MSTIVPASLEPAIAKVRVADPEWHVHCSCASPLMLGLLDEKTTDELKVLLPQLPPDVSAAYRQALSHYVAYAQAMDDLRKSMNERQLAKATETINQN